ncbi:helix-turn-helix domain-containing protein [Roseovarius sp. MBR-6]|jgi:hypothetical protein|uniref:helix-turn-helix domain-containing protein n=1 Tax=Roseovarius sp. MBR-6 TaxID=3156459 RepID=UPI003396424D
MRRSDICLHLGSADRSERQDLIINRIASRKLVWRAGIVLATVDGHGTFEIMRRTNMSKPTVRRWQEPYLDEGVAGGSSPGLFKLPLGQTAGMPCRQRPRRILTPNPSSIYPDLH